jgi:hypothetical protein
MIEWEVTETGLRVFDDDNSELSVTAAGFEIRSDDADLPRPVDTAVDLSAEELRFPVSIVYLTSVTSGERYELGDGTSPLELPDDEYVVDIDAQIKVYLQFEGSVTVRTTDGFDEIVVSFPETRRCIAGFRRRHEHPAGVIEVPSTPEGLATALTHLPSSHKTAGTDRSFPTLRGHPPLIETSDGRTAIPDDIADETPDTGVELVAPPSFEKLFVLSPLAYYLQASVAIEDREAPVLRAPAVGVSRDLDPLPDLERDATRLLRKSFFLDCLVRNVGPYATNLAEASLLDALGLDAEALYDCSPAQRLATYVDVPYGAIEQRLPDWHLTTYVDPGPDRVDCLPFLLDDMSLVYRPRTSELEGSELIERSLNDFYRGPSTPGSAGQVASVDVVKPELRGGRIHGWLAEGTPIDVFKSSHRAYENRLSYLQRESDETTVTVVLNDDEMGDEHDDVERIYRERGEDISLDVTVREHLPQAELAREFESHTDFVHYIGHCETHGLRCPDGYLSASSLSECNAETFFLNACGSFHQGRELVERGSVAGAVTFSGVLNDHAVKVGSTFARLLVHGFSMERAVRLARRRIMMGKDYAVVGDGTHVLTQSSNRLPATVTLQETDAGGFLLTYDQFSAGNLGAFYRPYIEGNEYSYLCGNESEFALDREATRSFLRRAEMPVIYDGDLYWSGELYGAL